MAEIVKVVQQGFDCQMCGHAWVPRGQRKPPRRCPNDHCRSMRWDREKYPNAGPPLPPNSGGDGTGDGQRTCYQTLPLTVRKPSSADRTTEQAEAARAA